MTIGHSTIPMTGNHLANDNMRHGLDLTDGNLHVEPSALTTYTGQTTSI